MTPRVLSESDLREALASGGVVEPADGETLEIAAMTIRRVLVARTLTADPHGFSLARVVVKGDLDLSRAELPQFRAVNCQFEGTVNLAGAKIAGDLVLWGSEVLGVAETGYSLTAEGASIDGGFALSDTEGERQPFRCRGAVLLSGVDVSGSCLLKGAIIEGTTGKLTGFSVRADRLKTGGPLYAQGLNTAGSLSLVSASIGDQVNLSRFTSGGVTARDCSLQADSISTGGPFYAEDMKLRGAVSVIAARINGPFSLLRSNIGGSDSNGCSLLGVSAKVEGDVRLANSAWAGGHNWKGAEIGRVYDTSLARVELKDASLDFTDARIDRLRLTDSVGAHCRILLDNSTIARLDLQAGPEQLPKVQPMLSFSVEGVAGQAASNWRGVASWLRPSGRGIQPWYEVAACFDRAGRRDDATRMRYEAEGLATASALQNKRKFSWLLRTFSAGLTGYGFYPLRTLGCLAVILVLTLTLSWAAAPNFTVSTTDAMRADLATTYGGPDKVPNRTRATECTVGLWDVECFDPTAYAFSVALPALGLDQHWDPPVGCATYVFGALRGFSWLLTALILAGFTGLLRPKGGG